MSRVYINQMIKKSYILLLTLLMALCSCSTQKNTGATRWYHRTKTKYNIEFNGKNAYIDGLQQIVEAHEDNYGEMLPLYPVSDHKAAEASAGKMDITIEKCRKCIKLHSIKVKPKPDSKRMKDPKYKEWLKQEEFNSELANAWLLLGQAEFHKGDFIGSVGTFNYIIRHYQNDADVVAQCQLWVARAYAEMGWLYEAEDMLSKVQADNLKRKHASLYAAATADIKLKTKQYKDAIPFVKLAMPDEKRKGNRARFAYVLGQLYETENRPAEAYEAYKKCTQLYPPVLMDFNAHIRMSLVSPDEKKAVHQLKRMAKNYKYREQLDVLYGAIGDIYMMQRDTANALENYELAIEKSEKNGMDKAAVLLKAGDIYYTQRNYAKAAPCYSEAITILPAESDSYQRIRTLAEVLDELSKEYEMVVLQDSLQHLATLSEEEQQKIAEQLVADLRKAEAEDSAKAAQKERENRDKGLSSVNTSKIAGGSGAPGKWYFYNPQLMRNGKQEFTNRWGNRPLEDNWRRRNKASSGDWTPPSSDDENESGDIEPNDSIPADSVPATKPLVTDVYDPVYYLQQIPRTPEDFAQSDSLIADALFKMIFIYKNQLQDTVQAAQTFEEFCRRFPQDKRCVELYYIHYLDALKDNQTAKAEMIRQDIVTKYPDSKQAQIVSDPQYFARLREMAAEQDSVYEATYNAFRAGEFSTVKANTQHAEQNYPLSPLMPRFLFLNAVAKARTEGKEAFAESLKDMITRYPDSELAAMSRDMLAMLGQGMESQTGGSLSTLAAKREDQQSEEQEADSTLQFSPDREVGSYVLLLYPNEPKLKDEEIQADLNNMLYEVALFNFTRFLIRDFDLTALPAYSAGPTLRISGLESMDEAEWYIGLLMESEEIKALIDNRQITVIPISETNSKLIGNGKTMSDYNEFMKQQQ